MVRGRRNWTNSNLPSSTDRLHYIEGITVAAKIGMK
jgi:hypothetical protein